MERFGHFARWPALAGLILFCCATAHSQFTEGSIVGNVTDASGAAIVGAAVQVTDVQTAITTDVKTDSTGFYRALHLQAGTYRVTVTATGFKKAVMDSIPVNVNNPTRIDARLQPGQVNETVEVTGAPPLVQTEEGRLTGTLTTQEVQNLPLNGRQVYQLVSLEPGVTATNAPVISNVPSPTSSVTFDFGYIANGATPRGNNFVLDGNSNNNEWLGGTPLIYPSLDAIQEVQVQTLNFSAEYGRNNGTVVNVVTKSGTNDFHGDVFYSGRNTALNARNYFDTFEKTPLQQHQFGATFGGPIIRDKAFFFLDYEGSRLKDGLPEVVTTENPAYRQSVISSAPTSVAAMFFRDFPGPNCTAGALPATVLTCSATAPQIERNQADQYLTRADYHFSSHDQFYARWINTIASGDVARQELLGANIRGFTAPFSGFFADLGLGYTHEFSATTLNDLRFAYSRNNSNVQFGIPPSTATARILKADGLPANSFGDLVFDDGTIPMGGELFIPRTFIFNTFAVTDTFTHVIGHHSLKIGGDVRRIQENSDYTLETYPFYEFGCIGGCPAAFAPDPPSFPAGDAPYLVAATIDRNPNSPNFGGFTDTPRHFRWTQWALFAQDDWKVFPRLTVNAGLRYEVFGPPSETNGILTNITLGSGSNLFQRIATAKVGRVGTMWNTDYHNFAPRLGLSWDPTGRGATAVRSGFSIAYNEPYSNLYSNASRLNPPDAATMFVEPSVFIGTSVNYQFPFKPSPDFAGPVTANGGVGPISATAVPPSITPNGVYPTLRTAYSEQWFLGIQHQFLNDYGVSVNYVGTRGVGGYTREDYNRFDGDVCNPTRCNFFATRLAPGWGTITYISNESQATYHGLNAQFKKTYAHDVTFVANYTFGKVLDNVTEGGLGDYFNVNSYAGNYSGVMDIQHPNLDRGPAEFDVRHRFTANAIWNLPSPKSAGAINKVLGGWQLNSIVTLQSGRPFDVDCTLGWFAGCDFQMDGDNYARPNLPAGLKLSGFSNQQLVNGLFGSPALTFYGPTVESRTSSAIQVFCPNGLNSIIDFGPSSPCIPVGQDGNMGRNIFRGPAFKDVDLGLFKNTKVGERVNVQFRAEAFNLFNRVNLYNPIGNMGSPQFGQSVTAFPARELQLGLKLLF
jgi:outer membrane receptor protein involved in Fe transport